MSGKRLAQGAAITAAVTLLGILLAEHACADDDVDVLTPLSIYGAGRGADYASTRYGLARGAREGHPITRALGPAPALLLATAGLTGLDIALQKKGHRGWAKALRIGATAISLGVAARNIAVARRLP